MLMKVTYYLICVMCCVLQNVKFIPYDLFLSALSAHTQMGYSIKILIFFKTCGICSWKKEFITHFYCCKGKHSHYFRFNFPSHLWMQPQESIEGGFPSVFLKILRFVPRNFFCTEKWTFENACSKIIEQNLLQVLNVHNLSTQTL